MYSTCIFCSASLGRNEAIENFPVGARVAFDPAKGRLWAVCARCGRWNLAPIEERWEAVEEAERLFRATHLRVQSENIGQARLPDGTRLIRIGQALPGELAAWRYGGQLLARRNNNLIFGGALVTGGVVLAAGMPFLMAAGVPLTLVSSGLQLAAVIQQRREELRIVHRIAPERSPTGAELVLRRQDLYDARLSDVDSTDIGLKLFPGVGRKRFLWRDVLTLQQPLQLSGDDARQVVARAMVRYNHRGAKKQDIEDAVRAIHDAGGPAQLALRTAASGAVLARRPAGQPPDRGPTFRQIIGTFRGEIIPVRKYGSLMNDDRPRLSRTDALALEMSLHEESERRALEGELTVLAAAWRKAEAIARIADALPDEPPDE
jgi:hypothetical protein